MGIISKIGAFLDRRFPERISVEEVMKSLAAYSSLESKLMQVNMDVALILSKLQAFETGARAFDKELKEVKDEMNKAKAVLAVMNRVNQRPVLSSSEPWKR